MNKSSGFSSFKNLDFQEGGGIQSWIEWLSSYKKALGWAIFLLFALLIIAYRLISLQTLKTESDFFQAQAIFNQFQQVNNSEKSDFTASQLEQLKLIMQRNQELKPKYEGSIAQTLLIENQVSQAESIIQDIFKRTQEDALPLYQNYTKTTLLVEEEDYLEALQAAEQLESQLNSFNEQTTPFLYVFNLIRLGLLYQQMNRIDEELKIWQLLSSKYLQTFLVINDALKIGQVSLNDYIEERKNKILS